MKDIKQQLNVLMYDLTLKKMEDVKIGDLLMGDDGTYRRVISKTNKYGKIYNIHQTSGEDYFTNGEHTLVLKKSETAKRPYGNITKKGTLRHPNGRLASYEDYENMNIIDFLQKSLTFRENFFTFKPTTIHCEEKEVYIDPYLLGIWLGDGFARNTSIISMDDEIIKYIYEYADKNNLSVSKLERNWEKADVYKLNRPLVNRTKKNELLENLRRYDLINNKHIPKEYINNSERVRIELMAGLIDTDGSLSKNKVYEFYQKSYNFIRDVKIIADSLGFRTGLHEKKNCTCNGKNYGTHYRLSISGDLWRIPCKVKRKKVTKDMLSKNKDWRVSMIKPIEIGDGEYTEIKVDGNGNYLLGDFTLAHNSI